MERVVDIADAAVKHMQHVVQSSDMDGTGKVFFFYLAFAFAFALPRLTRVK